MCLPCTLPLFVCLRGWSQWIGWRNIGGAGRRPGRQSGMLAICGAGRRGSHGCDLHGCDHGARSVQTQTASVFAPTTPDSILVLLTRHSLVDHALLRLRFPSLCGRARRSGGPKLVRPTRQPPCAHPSTRRRLLSPLSCIAYGWAIALGGRWDANTSSALFCPHTFPRAATPDGARALPTRRR